ncbi:MAG TPA: hypothetical protein VMK32_05950 [Burkholderiaceae bacterium]|nr:hypothetical protein [Burkholderiaceae bacterium]
MLISLALAAQAQTAPPPATRPDTGASTAATPARPAAKPPQRIDLPAAEKQALEAASGGTATDTTPTADELVPTEADTKAPLPEEPRTRIEQIRTRNGVSEVRVTPALTGRTYTITNREGQQPLSATESLSGLSVPKFFTFEFGRPADRAASPPLPPPPSSQSR